MKKPGTVEADLPAEPQREIFPVTEHTIVIPTKGIKKRRYAVIEQPAEFTIQPEQQLVMATEAEMVTYRKAFPFLIVRWAENEDLAKWKVSASVFDRANEEAAFGHGG